MHDQHSQIRPLDLNLRFHFVQKAAGSFVSGEKLLRTFEPKPRPSRLQTRALVLWLTSKLCCEDGAAEPDKTTSLSCVVYKLEGLNPPVIYYKYTCSVSKRTKRCHCFFVLFSASLP